MPYGSESERSDHETIIIHEKNCVKDVLNFTDSELAIKKNCAIIAPSRARACFENKRFDWLSVNFFVH